MKSPLEYDGRFVRRREWKPARDRRAEGAGVELSELWYVLLGESGAVSFSVMTGWLPYQPQANIYAIDTVRPFPVGVSLHLPDAVAPESWQAHAEVCPWIGGPCRTSTAGLAGDYGFAALQTEGEDRLFAFLAEHYDRGFGEIRLPEGGPLKAQWKVWAALSPGIAAGDTLREWSMDAAEADSPFGPSIFTVRQEAALAYAAGLADPRRYNFVSHEFTWL